MAKKTKGEGSRGFNPVFDRTRTWFCVECALVLGYTNEDRTELRIKYRDLFLEILRPESVSTACRRCGKWNIVTALPS